MRRRAGEEQEREVRGGEGGEGWQGGEGGVLSQPDQNTAAP